MEQKQFKALDTVRRVQGFLDTNGVAIGNLVPAKLRAQLDKAAADLTVYQVEQGKTIGTAAGETSNLETYRRELFDMYLQRISGLAHLAVPSVPEMPSFLVSSSVLNNDEFLQIASTVADLVAQYEQQFVDVGMPAGFVGDMKASIARVTASLEARGRHLGRRASATKGLGLATQTVRSVVRALDLVLRPVLKNDGVLAADWKASRRIRQTPVTPNPTGITSSDETANAAPTLVTPTTKAAAAA